MPSAVTIRRPEGPVPARIELPRSKSLANRALVLAALADDMSCVTNAGDADDTRILLDQLTERPRVMHCGDGGTTFRFLLAWACVQEDREHVLTGNSRLLERPHDVLVEALCALGADITHAGEGYRVRGKRMDGGPITIDSPVSSQYISALLLVAPRFRQGLQLHWTGRQLSGPYVHMTMEMLRHFGAQATMDGDVIDVPASRLKAAPFDVPRDWSAAAFWLEVMALVDTGELGLSGLHPGTWQGDERAVEHWSSFVSVQDTKEGAALLARTATKIDRQFDLTDTPDLFQPLAFTCAGRGVAATFTGLHNLPLKETDRLRATADALRTLGCTASYDNGVFTQSGQVTTPLPPPFDPEGDHRMAMALAPLALLCERITILNPAVVAKSYPLYWEDLRSAGFHVRFPGN